MSTNKSRLIEYFDSLIRRVDLIVRNAIAYNQNDERLVFELNNQRGEFVKEILFVQSCNLRELAERELKSSEELSSQDLFQKFCFFIEFKTSNEKQTFRYENLVAQDISLRLIVTNRYLDKDQIKCYERLFYVKMNSPFDSSIRDDVFFKRQENQVKFNYEKN
jgi:hypothetical protein